MIQPAPIPQTDPRAAYLAQKTEIDAAIMQVLESGQYILGRAVEQFEREFAANLGLAHGIGCASGTDALELALRACGIGEGHLVFTVSHTAVASVAAIERAGAKPVLVDIEPGGFAMDPAALDAALRDAPPGRPAAILPVHLYGEPADLAAIGEIARAQGLRVIEDCAQSHGAVYRRRPAGSFGDIACFSFYPTKNLGALGDAGIIATPDAALAEAAREIREYGWRERYVSARSGINTRLDPIQAAVLSVKLPRLKADNERRQAIAARYDEGLSGLPIGRPRRRADTSHVFHQYVIRGKDRDRLREHLRAGSIGTGIHYPVPVHLHPAYRSRVALGPTGLRNSEKAAGEILSLPIYPQLADDAVDRVIAEIRKFFG
ncbi:MAG: DegT/DnrJ/EryC1/StrS family aminotransferase [Alphaproteobacteria bacterium]|jgi:dTDP-4-amino-4,6-dideoxygalactose transaminase|nr:MAG: DegT/DnrJ/EryC1/StrS family aminotransferase [Alphaproteobacteria bacterium]